jgi:PAS domain S-box-containing protein
MNLETPAGPAHAHTPGDAAPTAWVWILLVGLVAATAAMLWKQGQINRDAQARFGHRVEAVVDYVEQRLQRPIHGLKGARGLYAASKSVGRAEFQAYVDSRDMPRDFQGVHGFGFIQYVPRPALNAFLAATRADGAPQFALRQLADKDHDDLYITKFIEPSASNAHAVGLDIGSEPTRRAAAQRAVDTGEATLSARLTLVQDPLQTPGALLLLAVYTNGSHPTSTEERRAALLGLVYAPLVMSEVLNDMPDVLAGRTDFELFDGPASTLGSNLLFDAVQHTAKLAARNQEAVQVGKFFSTQTLSFAGRDLELRVHSTAQFDASIDHTAARLAFIAIGLLSLMMALLFRAQANSRQRAQARALQMTRELRAEIQVRKQVEFDLIQQQLTLEKRVQQKTKAAVQSEHHLRLVINTSLDAMIGMDSQGNITEWSRQAEVTFGWTSTEVLGLPMKNIIVPLRYREAHQKGLEHYLATGVGVVLGKRIEITALHRDGNEFPVELAISPIITPQGTTFSAFIRDVTQRKQEQTALLHATETAENANRAKSEFLANMSHEIRTPMNGVIGMVDILLETGLSPEQRRMAGTISQSSLALLQILNDILDFSKIEAGMLEMESVPIPLRGVAEGVAQLLVSLPGPATAVSLVVSTQLPTWVWGDPTRLRQVLLNLMGNALKFSTGQAVGQAHVSLIVTCCVLPSGAHGARFEVSDHGIGMDPELVAKLFQPFTQADASTARKFGGTGLGLSISKRLVELMGGSIAVRSTLGKGSVFTVELPLQAAPAASALPATPSLAGVRVLIVACTAVGIAGRTDYCEHAGAQVSAVADVAAARDFLAQLPTGQRWVVLVDSSVTALTAALGLPAHATVVRETTRFTQIHHPNDILLDVRPMLHGDLMHAIARASGRWSQLRTDEALERRTPKIRPTAPTVAQAVRAGRLILLAEDNDTNRTVILEQLRLLGYACEAAEDGAVARTLWQANPARYALLLTDCHMPNLDGFGLTEAIRSAELPGTHLPIIAVTANAMQGEAQRCRERGMDDFLTKPLRMGALRTMLAKWLPVTLGAGSVAVVQTVDPTADGSTLAVWNPTTLTNLVGDNPGMHKRLLEKFLVNSQMQVSEMAQAATASDWATVARVAHSLKSAARSVGALRLGDLCQHLETTGRSGDAETCRTLGAGLPAQFAACAAHIQRHLDR